MTERQGGTRRYVVYLRHRVYPIVVSESIHASSLVEAQRAALALHPFHLIARIAPDG